MLLEELLWSYIGDIYTADESDYFLSEISIGSKTAKVWVDCLG